MTEFVLYAYIVAAAVITPLVRIQGAVHGYHEVKDSVFMILTALGFVFLLGASGLPFNPSLGWKCLLGVVALTSLSILWTDTPEASIREIPKWFAVLFFVTIAGMVPERVLMPALFIPAVVGSLYGGYQQITAKDPIDRYVNEMMGKHRKKLRFYGWMGNSNYSGIWLAPQVYVGIWLVLNVSLWWLPGLAIVFAGLIMTRCRAAFLGVMVGFLPFVPSNLLIFAVPLFAAFAIAGWKRLQTIKTRLHLWRVALYMACDGIFFGIGPAKFRRGMFKAQAILNQKDPTILGTIEEKGRIESPLSRRVHNDYIETFMEIGLVGLGLWIAFYVFSILGARDPEIVGGLLAGAVGMFFFYPQRVIGMGMPIYALAGLGLSQGAPAASLPVHPIAVVILGGIALKLAWEFGVRYIRATHYFFQAMLLDPRKKEARILVRKALELDPKNGYYLTEAARVNIQVAPALALQYNQKALDHYDGEKIEWSLWKQAGTMLMANNAVHAARAAFSMALYLNPSFKAARDLLEQCDRTIQHIEKQIKRHQGKLKRSGGIYVPQEKEIEIAR